MSLQRVLFISLAWILCRAGSASAQEKLFIFPQIADGVFSDGTSYRSTLMVEQWLSAGPINCTMRLNGLVANFGSGMNSQFSFTIPKDGWALMRSSDNQSFASGYAVLTCSDYVFANILYTYYSAAGVKLSEATVFGVDPNFDFFMIADQTETSRLGIAIANDSDIQKTYTVTLRRSDGSILTTSSLTIGARRSLAKFLDELTPSTANQRLEVEIQAKDLTDFAVIGLRYTGPVFTTIPAN